MNIELDWQVADDDGAWEPIAHVGAQRRPRLPVWVWHVGAAVVVLLGVGAAVGVRYRYRRVLRQVTAQIQDVVDLEAHALAQGDVARYLAQQDTSLPNWVAWQADRIGWACPEVRVPAPVPGLCPLATPVQIARVEMRGDVAWVEVVQPQTALRQVRFYRQTCQGWLHTAPRAAFWRDSVEWTSGRVLVRAHRRDVPHIEPPVAHIVDVVDDVCATLDCPADVVLEVRFSFYDGLPMLSDRVLTLASPWLTGVPVDAARDGAYLHALTYWAAYGIASQMVRYDDDPWQPDPTYPPDPARKEMLHTCAALYSRGGRHGEDARPEMLGPMQDGCSLRGFAAY